MCAFPLKHRREHLSKASLNSYTNACLTTLAKELGESRVIRIDTDPNELNLPFSGRSDQYVLQCKLRCHSPHVRTSASDKVIQYSFKLFDMETPIHVHHNSMTDEYFELRQGDGCVEAAIVHNITRLSKALPPPGFVADHFSYLVDNLRPIQELQDFVINIASFQLLMNHVMKYSDHSDATGADTTGGFTDWELFLKAARKSFRRSD